MDIYIRKILDDNKHLFGTIKNIKKINKGFTNLLYIVNNKFVIKICFNKENEENFKNEINFYKFNGNNSYIPKLYAYFISSSKNDYSYEILEKIDGYTIYHIWHTLSEKQRKEIIKELVSLMKLFHTHRKTVLDWSNYFIDKLKVNFHKCYQLNLFSLKEKSKLEFILNHISPYLKSYNFCLVHADIHFDNLFLTKNNKLKIIDFETSLYAPMDYELDIFLRMCRNPWKYASEEDEQFIKIEDYKNIKKYLKEFYPDIFLINHFNIRSKIYDLEYNLRLLSKFPNDLKLKKDIKDIINKLFLKLQKRTVN